jgi:hypothetical protein
MKKLIVLLVVLCTMTGVHAQETVLISALYGADHNNIAVHQYGLEGNYIIPYDLLVAPDGDFIAMARSNWTDPTGSDGFLAIYKTTADGKSFDYDFGYGGVVVWPPAVHRNLDKGAMAFDSQGRIIIAAVNNSQLTLVRLTAGGDLDTTFDEDGIRNHTFDFTLEFVHDLIVDTTAGDAIYPIGLGEQSGDRDGVVFRFDSAGNLDTNFATGGIQRVNTGPDDAIYAGALDAAHLTVAGKSGDNSLFARYHKADGTADSAFAGSGIRITDYSSGLADALNDIVYTQDGDFVAIGSAGPDMLAVSIEPDGSADLGFDADGVATFRMNAWGASTGAVAISAGAMDEDSAGNLWIVGIALEPLEFQRTITWILKADGTNNRAIHHGSYVQELLTSASAGFRRIELSDIVAVVALDNGRFAYLGRSGGGNRTGAYLHIARSIPNLLVNGGFEEAYPNGKPVGWKLKNPSGDGRLCDPPTGPRVSFSGSCAFRFKGNAGEASVLSHTVTAQPGIPLAVAGDHLLLGAEVAKPGWMKFTMKVTYANGVTKVVGHTYSDLFPYYAPAYPLRLFYVKRDVVKIKIILRGVPKRGKFYLDNMTLTAVTPISEAEQAATLSMPLLPLPPAP